MDKFRQTTRDLCSFISASPSRFHVIENVSKMMEKAGFLPLSESSRWTLTPGNSYYAVRGGSALIAFCLPEGAAGNYQIIASHCDSPSFKIKESPEIEKTAGYVQLNVEKNGGALLAPWFDRPLGIAGRLIVEEDGSIKSLLVDSNRALAMIPSLAIHMNRKANEETHLNIQSDMLPVFGSDEAKGSFQQIMAAAAGVSEDKVLGSDLYLYDRSAPSFWGANEEFFSSPKLDNLQNVYASVQALLNSAAKENSANTGTGLPIRVCCILDNEEVGSRSRQGADSTFLSDILERIRLGLSIDQEDQLIMLSKSFMISADNSHALHPNHPEKADPVNRPALNSGVVIKHSANQKYTTDAVSAAIFRSICKKAAVPFQEFTNHSDIPGGSTLGNISISHVSVLSVDIGCPQLAMHSPYETAGVNDTLYMMEAMKAFYETPIKNNA